MTLEQRLAEMRDRLENPPQKQIRRSNNDRLSPDEMRDRLNNLYLFSVGFTAQRARET